MRPLFCQLDQVEENIFLLAIAPPQNHDASTFYGPIHMCPIYVPKSTHYLN